MSPVLSPVVIPPCNHTPPCPSANAMDRDAAHVIISHPEQDWSLLCNGVVLFGDTGEILPDGVCVNARRSELTACAPHRAVAVTGVVLAVTPLPA